MRYLQATEEGVHAARRCVVILTLLVIAVLLMKVELVYFHRRVKRLEEKWRTS